MKKLKKESLRLEKEIITSLNDQNLATIRGGGGPDTYYSNCICASNDGKTCNDTTTEIIPQSTGIIICKPVTDLETKNNCPTYNINCKTRVVEDCQILSYVNGGCNI